MSLQLLAAAIALSLAASSAARASPLRVLLLVGGGERERQLAARVEGHTADLEVQITTEESPLLVGSDRPVEAALSAAAARAADLVVWFTPELDGWVVHAARGDRVFRRRIGPSTGAMSESASTEAAALVVRTAVKALTSGEDLPVEDSAPVPPPSWRLWGGAGWAGILERQGPAGRHGVAGLLGVARGKGRLAAAVTFHPAVVITSANATIRVDRLLAGATAAVDLLGQPGAAARFRLSPELTVAAARYSRTTSAVGSGLAATSPKATWTPVVTPAVGASWRVASGCWVAATLGAEILGRRPELGVEGGGGFEPMTTLWPVQPRATLSVLIDSF